MRNVLRRLDIDFVLHCAGLNSIGPFNISLDEEEIVPSPDFTIYLLSKKTRLYDLFVEQKAAKDS